MRISRSFSSKPRILLLTGFAPLELSQLDEMGSVMEPFLLFGSITKKNVFQITIPSIGATVVATYLNERDNEIEVKDFFLDDVDDCEADIIGISSTFMGTGDVKEIAAFVRKRNPTSYIVLGGPLSWSITPPTLLNIIPEIDFIVIGEGEQTFLELLHVLSLHGDPGKIAGVISRDSGGHSVAGRRIPLDASSIPTPNWKLIDLPDRRRLPMLPVETSRGCPYSCHYCSETHFWGKPPRYRDTSSVVREITRNVSDFGISTFRFTDSCFSSPPKRCADVCDTIYRECIQRGISVKWSSYARVSNLTPRLLEKMKQSGCVALDVGVESGDPAMLRKMGRRYSPDQAVTVAYQARKVGIITNFNIVIGFPGETVESIDRTIEMLDRARPDTFACFLLFVAPNMTVSSRHDRYGINGTGLSWRHSTMASDEAVEAMERISKSVTGSCSFPGGEYFACYLTSLGYSNQEVKSFFQATSDIIRGNGTPSSRSIVEQVCTSLKNFW